jgi:hypothetical protein
MGTCFEIGEIIPREMNDPSKTSETKIFVMWGI